MPYHLFLVSLLVRLMSPHSATCGEIMCMRVIDKSAELIVCTLLSKYGYLGVKLWVKGKIVFTRSKERLITPSSLYIDK